MNVYEKIVKKEEKIAVIGLGYVGMPIAVELAKKVKVIGFDNNQKKIELYKNGIDPTNEVGNEVIKNTTVEFTKDEKKIQEAIFNIVAVPTPINLDKTPDLTPVIKATETVGKNLKRGAYVVYESTVYPGVTEEICIPILEKESGMKCGTDFKVGYSPERINPGDKNHRLTNIKKIVSGIDKEALEIISKVYELVVEVGVHKVSNIKTAEAAKVVENSQRDINIAFMNELAMVFDRMGINTNEVVEAMNTKWNALKFYPGLVGGHCIGVDPYYFVYQAEKLGYHSQIILSGRKINDGMGEFVGRAIIKNLVLANKKVKESKVVILGITFKEDCPDVRNSKVIDIIESLKEYGITPTVVDDVANKEEVERFYNIKLKSIEEINEADCIVFAVAHKKFRDMEMQDIENMLKTDKNEEKIIIDVKSILNKEEIERKGYRYWNL